MDISIYTRHYILLILQLFGGVQSTCIASKRSTEPTTVNRIIDSEKTSYEMIKCKDLEDMHSTSDICKDTLCSITFESINRTISSKTFINFPKINVLDLSGLKIGSIQEEAFTGENLEEILLQKNNLSRIPSRSIVSNNLKHLDLSENSIEVIEDGAFLKVTGLKFLDLSNNNLSSISEKVLKSLSSLETLNISRNFLSSPNLRFICHVKKLHILIADRNNFIELPACFSQMNISNLSISHNKLSTLGFALPKTLHQLFLGHNYIEELHMGSIEELEFLEILDVSSNEITFIPKLTPNLKKLRLIDLSSNKLSILSLNIFENLHNLQTLNLSLNRINNFSIGNIPYFESLQNLDLSQNKIELIDISKLLEICPRLNFLKIDGNKFSCSALISILYFAKNKNVIIPPGVTTEIENINGITCSGDWIVLKNSIQSLQKTITELKYVITHDNNENPDHTFSASINNNRAYFKNKQGQHRLINGYSSPIENKKIDDTVQQTIEQDGASNLDNLKHLSEQLEILILRFKQLIILLVTCIVAIILFYILKRMRRFRGVRRGTDCSSLEMPMLQANHSSKF